MTKKLRVIFKDDNMYDLDSVVFSNKKEITEMAEVKTVEATEKQ
jgi:hypothetical protein